MFKKSKSVGKYCSPVVKIVQFISEQPILTGSSIIDNWSEDNEAGGDIGGDNEYEGGEF